MDLLGGTIHRCSSCSTLPPGRNQSHSLQVQVIIQMERFMINQAVKTIRKQKKGKKKTSNECLLWVRFIIIIGSRFFFWSLCNLCKECMVILWWILLLGGACVASWPSLPSAFKLGGGPISCVMDGCGCVFCQIKKITSESSFFFYIPILSSLWSCLLPQTICPVMFSLTTPVLFLSLVMETRGAGWARGGWVMMIPNLGPPPSSIMHIVR